MSPLRKPEKQNEENKEAKKIRRGVKTHFISNLAHTVVRRSSKARNRTRLRVDVLLVSHRNLERFDVWHPISNLSQSVVCSVLENNNNNYCSMKARRSLYDDRSLILGQQLRDVRKISLLTTISAKLTVIILYILCI